MKFHIEAERRQFLSMVIEAASQEEAEEAALRGPPEAWDTDVDEETTITRNGAAEEGEEAHWRATEDGDLEPYEDPDFAGKEGGEA